ncbi:hypothetical protein ERX37_10350 [Macrococcus hajekii]|uniref:YdbS-like PH domain-containing protein n=1 Tax=Macrococcus hajekii TaxID=198482 RepID=A0A4R6BHQ9_9STAP|nr:PH domain-containing protein [Macrococcus hajekii]TDM01075.1 hypothetical protein ERX37_10350 [Macrococcus hajekii]GGB12601.1 membrane protein [Macrococcus hajekii]
MKKVDASAVKVWRLANAIWTFILLALLVGLVLIKFIFFNWLPDYLIYMMGGLIMLQAIWFIGIEPLIAYRTHKYELKASELVTRSGIFIKKETIIPFVRIQNVETQVGPIMKRYHLKSVEVTTAGGGTVIELISAEEAESIKKMIDEAVNRLEGRYL